MPVEGKATATRKIEPERRRTCSACGMMGHLATTCENPVRYHDKLGIEIEGFWRDLAAAKRQAEELTGRRGNSDGSLPSVSSCSGEEDPEDPCGCGEDDCSECNSAHPCSGSCNACGARSWEFQTRPGTLGESLRQLTQLYPDVVNAACGMHVHMSFLDKSSITMLTSEEFFAYFRDRFKAWGESRGVKGEFWKRLNGDNSYCRKNAKSDWHRTTGCPVSESTDRYRQINFQAYSEHATVEFRLLPMFRSAALGVNAIEELTAIVESYLGSAALSHEASSGAVQPQRIEGLAGIEQEIPLAISQAARDALLPREINREIEIVDTADLKATPGALVVPAYKLRDSAYGIADKLHSELEAARAEARRKARIR